MPEGNEIHRWAERHAAAFAGKVVRVDSPQGRFLEAEVLDGRKLKRVLAAGKHLGYDFGRDRILHVHLGMYGDFSEGSGPLPEVKGALRLRMWKPAAVKLPPAPGKSKRHAWYSSDDGTGHIAPEEIGWVELRGPTDCSLFSQEKWNALLMRLGPDPLNGDGAEKAIARIRGSATPIGALLMDQTVIAGIGNIYRAELLFRARLSPFIKGREVPEAKLKAIWREAVRLMRAGMADRRIVTTRAKDRPTRAESVHKDEVHYVYRRKDKPCFLCGSKVERRDMAGRNLFWCRVCQAE